MNIITDTNIWYGIEGGKIILDLPANYRLNATYINLFELSITPRLIDDMEYISRVVRTLHDAKPIIIEKNPIEYIIQKQYPDYQITDEKYKEMLVGFEKLMDVDFRNIDPDLYKEATEKFKITIEEWRRILQKLADDVNQLLPELREKIKQSTGKKVHRAIHSLPLFPELLNLYVKSFTNDGVQLDIETYPWEEIELFVRVWDNFFKDLEVSPNQKFQPNDWFDLFNLVYVGKDSKYWTNEKKWLRLISSDSNTAQYLFKK